MPEKFRAEMHERLKHAKTPLLALFGTSCFCRIEDSSTPRQTCMKKRISFSEH